MSKKFRSIIAWCLALVSIAVAAPAYAAGWAFVIIYHEDPSQMGSTSGVGFRIVCDVNGQVIEGGIETPYFDYFYGPIAQCPGYY